MTTIWIVPLVLATGCIESLAPEVGEALAPTCSSVDSDPANDVSFDFDLQRGVFASAEGHCVKCHTPAGATPIGIAIGGLDLTSYATLRNGGTQSGAAIVVPGDPCASLLVGKLGNAPPFGARMPFDGPPYLSERARLTIADWIAEGARDN